MHDLVTSRVIATERIDVSYFLISRATIVRSAGLIVVGGAEFDE